MSLRLLIVTTNLKHFAPEVMPEGIRAISADEFLLELIERAPAQMVDVIWLQAMQKKRPPLSVRQVVDAIGRSAPEFARAIRRILDVRTAEQLMKVTERLEQAVHAPVIDVDELSAALADACLLDPEVDALVTKQARKLSPLAVRQLAGVLVSGEGEARAEAGAALRAYGVDPERHDVAGLTDDQILALLEKAGALSQ